MYTGSTFVAHRETAKTMQPGQGAFDHPAGFPQAAAVGVPVLAVEAGRIGLGAGGVGVVGGVGATVFSV